MISFFPDAIASWNIFIKILMMSHLLTSLRNILIPKVLSVYMILVGLRYLFQWRVSLSPLRSQICRHKIPSLSYVIVNKAEKIRVILYFHVLSMQFKEQP